MSGRTYYELLGVNSTATDSDIRRAYLRLSLQYHPDKRRAPATCKGDDLFRSIQEAYETLSCPEKRCLYDFVGAFALLADATSFIGLQPARQAAEAPLQPSSAPRPSYLRSAGSSGEMLHTRALSSSPSAFRSSPSPSSDTCLSTSPEARGLSGIHSSFVHQFSHDTLPCPDVCARDWAPSPGGPSQSPAPGPGWSSLLQPHNAPLPPDQSFIQSGPGPVAAAGPEIPSGGSLLGKRRLNGSDPPPGPTTWDPMQPHALEEQPPFGRHQTQQHQQQQPIGRVPARLVAETSLPGYATAPTAGPSSSRGGGGVCGGSGAQAPRPATVYHKLFLTLEEMYLGCVKQLTLQRQVLRRPLLLHSHGAAGSPCPGQPAAQAASACTGGAAGCGDGGGTTDIGIETGASGVHAAGSPWVVDSVEELFRVEVQPGWREGTKVTFQGKGDELPCGGAGDMVLVVAQAAHGRFERRGNDLHTVVDVPLVDALTGGHVRLSTLDGRSLVLELGPACLQPHTERVVRGEGMPIPPSRARGRAAAGATGVAATAAAAAGAGVAAAACGSGPTLPPGWSRGNLHVRFRVAFPPDLTLEQKEELRGTLGGAGAST